MKLKDAEKIVGKLSRTSKMPTFSISLSASACNTGSKLRNIPGSVCYNCYAHKGCYTFPQAKAAMQRRYDALDHEQWIEAMVYILTHKKRIVQSGLFRWHDSGDFQSKEHVERILEVARQTPDIIHWIPTKERKLANYAKQIGIPDNVVLRLSGAMIDGAAPEFAHTSTVVSKKEDATCNSYANNGKCGDCRMCWDKTIKNIAYLNH